MILRKKEDQIVLESKSKTIDLSFRFREIKSLSKLIEIHGIDETTLDSSFPNEQVHLPDYQFLLFRRDRNSSGGGKRVSIRNGIIAKRKINCL